MHLAHIVLDIPTRALDKPFTYAIPDGIGDVSVGCCVLVIFSGRPAVGYVVDVTEPASGENVDRLRPIERVLSTPYFDEVAAGEASWIAHEYLAPLSEAVRLFAPPGGTPKVKRRRTEDGGCGPADRDGLAQRDAADAVDGAGVNGGGTVTADMVPGAATASNWELNDASSKPVDDRWVSITEEGRAFIPPKTAVKQKAVLDALSESEMRVPELAMSIGAVNACIKSLEKRGLVRVERRRRIRGAAAELPTASRSLDLTEGQREALDAILGEYHDGTGGVVLVDGVTGSGKTEVYLQAIRQVIEEGHSAIVLVPEIALTPQTVGRFRARFGEQVAVLHSGMGVGERYDQWDLCRQGAAHVVVGARSALFAPMHDVRLIVIDEEHESTYKQDSSPRYHAREVAEHMMRERGGVLVLGSATPSLESLDRARRGCYRHIVLPQRANGASLPPVEVVDLAAEFKGGHRSMFSSRLQRELEATLDQGRKAVFLFNHRGFASYLQCRECGYVPTCDNCSVSLTYHAPFGGGRSELQCHHCGAVQTVPARCPECGSPYIRKVGKGTEQVHAALVDLVGRDVAIIRMDADTTRNKGMHEKLLEQFQSADSGILLGTQMIAKGLDFPDVTLVGVINADTVLNLPDFRSGERTWQLLEQVSGRAGRDELPGTVVIQTYWPQHPAIRAVAAHDRQVFVEDELTTRRLLHYPPYSRLVNILLWGRDRASVVDEATRLADQVQVAVDRVNETGDDGSDDLADSVSILGGDGWAMLGPSPCVLERLKQNWRWHILVKVPLDGDIPSVLGPVFKERKTVPGINVAVDVDALNLL